MTVSAAKLEANRRNAMRSCGPRTESGKQHSKLNAVKHGMRAATLVLLDEDPEAIEDRRADWAASLMPRGAAEQRIVDDAVEYSWLRDRARRAQEARLATDINNAGVDEAIRESDEVLRLGQKLFADNRGRLANYPHYDMEKDEYPENVPLVSQSDLVDDPEDPQHLVLHLQASAGGCQWMLDRWAELRSILEEGLNWQSADKLKAVRLLGRHPIDAVDDRNVLMIFIACQTIESQPIIPIPEIRNELREYERIPYAQRLIGRGIQKLSPKDAAAARQALYAVIDRATAQIAAKSEGHRMRAEINDSLAADRLAFDDSPEAERLRRFDLACGRGLARSLDSLLKLRRAPELAECPSSIISDPSFADGEAVESSAPANATIEPADTRENATNEPTDPSQRERKLLKRIRIRIKIRSRSKNKDRRPNVDREILTNEAKGAREIVTIEPTEAFEHATNEPVDCENATNRPTDAWETVTNDANAGCKIVAIELTDAVDGVTDEPTVACENTTNEPTLAAPAESNQIEEIDLAHGQERRFATGGPGSVRAGTGWEEARPEPRPPENGSNRPTRELTADMSENEDSDREEELDRQRPGDWNRAKIARVVALRVEKPRELNEEIGREAQTANAGRSAGLDWHESGEPADRPKQRAERTRQGTTETDTARTVGALAELVSA